MVVEMMVVETTEGIQRYVARSCSNVVTRNMISFFLVALVMRCSCDSMASL